MPMMSNDGLTGEKIIPNLNNISSVVGTRNTVIIKILILTRFEFSLSFKKVIPDMFNFMNCTDM